MKANMLDYLESTVERVPERIAFYDDQESLTFAALQESAKRISTCLAAVASPRTPVALLLDSRSIRNIPAVFGAIYAGCAYAPLDIASLFGILLTLLSFIVLIAATVRHLLSGVPVSAFSWLLCAILFVGGVQTFCIGILGKYLGKVYAETKHRPIYILAEKKLSSHSETSSLQA